jgi:hypothetical protein
LTGTFNKIWGIRVMRTAKSLKGLPVVFMMAKVWRGRQGPASVK